MPYQDSPGWERMWHKYAWDWDFHVSTVREGHQVVGDKDKQDAKGKGAKLTFGEVLDCGVARMITKLGGKHKKSFHDLGMGPGKMLIQAYLQFNNFNRCMGVELAKGRYDLGERNITTLLKTGWRGRKFIGIEIKKGDYFKIVEDVPNKAPKEGWKIGDKCIAYSPFLRKDKNKIYTYEGVIKNIIINEKTKKKTFEIKYDTGYIGKTQEKYLFIPGTQRTLEIWYGSLFDYPGGFDAEMCILETDFPESMHPELIKRMCSTPIGCTFLTYHDLKKFKCYDWYNLRQIDCNIYDNCRFITSWSQGWRFYIWTHIENQKTIDNNLSIKIDNIKSLNIGDGILFNKPNQSPNYGEILEKTITNDDEKETIIEYKIRTNEIKKDGVKYETIKINNKDYEINKNKHRFKLNEQVSCYRFDKTQHYDASHKYEIFYGKIIGIYSDKLEYLVQFDDNGLTLKEMYVFSKPCLLFNVGDRVMACWPRNAQNKNSPHRYKRFPGTIIGINNDATYRIDYDINQYLYSMLKAEQFPEEYDPSFQNNRGVTASPTFENHVSDCVREMWIQKPSKYYLENIIKPLDNSNKYYYQCDYTNINQWNIDEVTKWLADIGSNKFVNIFKNNNITGSELLKLNTETFDNFIKNLNEVSKNAIDDEKTSENNDNNKINNINKRSLYANIRFLQNTFKSNMNEWKKMSANGNLDDVRLAWKKYRNKMGASGGGGGGVTEDTDKKED